MPNPLKLAFATLILALAPALAYADTTYTVTQTGTFEGAGTATSFSFVVPTIAPFVEAGEGYTATITQISGAIVGDVQIGELGQNVPACGGGANGPAVFFFEENSVGAICLGGFAQSSATFASAGTYTNGDIGTTVTISAATPEPSSLLLLASGAVALLACRMRLN